MSDLDPRKNGQIVDPKSGSGSPTLVKTKIENTAIFYISITYTGVSQKKCPIVSTAKMKNEDVSKTKYICMYIYT